MIDTGTPEPTEPKPFAALERERALRDGYLAARERRERWARAAGYAATGAVLALLMIGATAMK